MTKRDTTRTDARRDDRAAEAPTRGADRRHDLRSAAGKRDRSAHRATAAFYEDLLK